MWPGSAGELQSNNVKAQHAAEFYAALGPTGPISSLLISSQTVRAFSETFERSGRTRIKHRPGLTSTLQEARSRNHSTWLLLDRRVS